MDTSCVKIKVLPPTDESVDDIIENSAKEQLKNLKEKYALALSSKDTSQNEKVSLVNKMADTTDFQCTVHFCMGNN